MKQFTMSMFTKTEHLLEAKVEHYESILEKHKSIFQWVKDNPDCHPENIRMEILRLLSELE